MSKLSLSFLGSPQIDLGGLPVTIRYSKAMALLIYLAVCGKPQRRDALATLLWPNSTQTVARSSLRRELSLLKKALAGDWLVIERETIGLYSDIWLDVIQFKQYLNSDDTLNKAVTLYRDDFLKGFTLPNCPEYDEWQFFQTESLRQTFSTALQRLIIRLMNQSKYEAAIPHVHRWLALDTLHEPAHQMLMRLYALTGQQTAALRQYQFCVDALADELSVAPSSETSTLFEQIRSGELSQATSAPNQSSFLTENNSRLPRHNLPQQLTSFIGREKEISAVSDLITQNRFVMLTGVGGIGKTNLSLQVGQRVMDSYPDGVWLIELAPIHDPKLVSQAAAAALRLRESADRSISDYLLDFLREKRCLLILDNCEHLINGVAPFVQTVLQHCPDVKILASSREVLAIPGERPFQVPPLTIPDNNQQSILEEWQQYESIRLFVERAQIVLPDFQVTANNVASLVQICQRLDGIPLALELAAARMKVLSADQITNRLDDRFLLLTNGNRAALPRQQTLRALVDWSWELLAESEKRLLQRLSVFVGKISLEAVEIICAGHGLESYDCLDLLHELVNKSLVIAKRETGQEPHYYLLETIRQYAQEKLTEAGEVEALHQRHLIYYRQFAETAASFLKGPDIVSWLNQLEDALDNIRVALDWAQQSDVESGLRLIFALTEFCWTRANVREMEARLGQLLAQTASVPSLVKANGIWLQGWLKGILHHHKQAIILLEKSLHLYRELGEQAGAANALSEIGHAYHMSGEMEKGHAALHEAIELQRSLGDRIGTAWALMSLGEGEMALGRQEQARACFQESVSLYRGTGNLSRSYLVLLRSGSLAAEQGDLEAALSLMKESQAVMESLGVKGFFAYILQYLGKLYYQLGDYPLAQTTFEESLLRSQESESYAYSYEWTHVHLGYAHLRGGNLAQAKQILSHGVQQFRERNDTIGVIYSLEGLASLAVQEEQAETAVRLFAWVDMTRQMEKNGRSHSEQTDVDRDITCLQDMLDKNAYAAAHAAGQNMTMAQAIAHALGDEN